MPGTYHGITTPPSISGGPVHHIQMWNQFGIKITSAEVIDRFTIKVTFDDDVDGLPLLVAGIWTVLEIDGVSDDCVVLSVAAGSTANVVILTLQPYTPLTPGGSYNAHVDSVTIHVYYQDVVFYVQSPGFYGLTRPDPEGIIASMLRASGTLIAQVGGSPVTRLRVPLAYDATEIYVETTMGIDEPGTIEIEGEIISFVHKTGTTFYGCVRDPGNLAIYPELAPSWPVGTKVYDKTMMFSTRDHAFNDTIRKNAQGQILDLLARDDGNPRPFAQMTEAGMQEFASTMYYLDRQTRWAVFRVLRALFGWADKVASDGAASVDANGTWITSAGIGRLSWYPDRFVLIGDRICRTITGHWDAGTGESVLLMDPTDHYHFGGHGLTGAETGLSITALPFRIEQYLGGHHINADGTPGPTEPAAAFRVDLYLPHDGIPSTYLMGTHVQIVGHDPAGRERPIAGKLLASTSVAGTDVWSLYLMDAFRTETLDVLRKVVAAGVHIDVRVFPS